MFLVHFLTIFSCAKIPTIAHQNDRLALEQNDAIKISAFLVSMTHLTQLIHGNCLG